MVLTLERREHIVWRHSDMLLYRASILPTVAMPEERMHGYEEREEWFFAGWPGPGRWLHVAVHFDDNRGKVRTAFPRRSLP